VIRTLVKNATACAVSWTGLDAVARARLHRDLPLIVAYHRVVERLNAGDGFALPAMEISTTMLERHLDWLGRHFRVVSLDALETELEKKSESRPLAAVTFDDGYRDVYDHAFPLLRRKGIPAGIFVITDLLGSSQLPMHERLHALLVGASRQRASFPDALADVLQDRKIGPDPFSVTRFLLEHLTQADVQRLIDDLEGSTDIGETWRQPLQPLSWEMVDAMRDGGMTIGSHTQSHPFLTNEKKECIAEEVESSRRELESRLGVEVRCFAYPGGAFNSNVIDAVAAAGYRFAFTICRHRDPRRPMLTIPRTSLWERSCLDPFDRFSPAIMNGQAGGAFNLISKCTQTHG